MYRNTGLPRDLSVDPEEMMRAQKRAARTRLLVVLVVLVVLAGAGVGGFFVLQARQKKQVKVAYGKFATCVVGDPLGAEKAGVRFRRLQIAELQEPIDKRAWPAICAPSTHAFAEAVKDVAGSPELVAATEKLAKALAPPNNLKGEMGPLVDDVFARAKAAGLDAERTPSPETAPAPVKIPVLADLPKEARFISPQTTLAGVHLPLATEPTLRVVVDEKDSAIGPVACSLAPGESVIACRKIPAPAAGASPALRMWGTTEPKAHVHAFAGDRGKSGIYDAVTGARRVEKLEYGAYGASALDDGSFAYLVWNDKPAGTNLVVLSPDGKAKTTKVVDRKESGNPYYSSAIFWSDVVYKQVKKGERKIRLIARAIDPAARTEKTVIGPVQEIGLVDEVGQIEGGLEEEPHMTACRSGKTEIIRAKGWENTFLYFKRDSWSTAVTALGQGGLLTCGEGTAAITKTWGGLTPRFKGGVTFDECTVSECKQQVIAWNKVLGENEELLPRDPKSFTAIELGGKLLVVWASLDAGVRMRVGRPEALTATPDTLLLDDHVREGSYRGESAIVGIQLLPYDKRAIMLLSTVEGVFAFVVDGDGKSTPLATRLE